MDDFPDFSRSSGVTYIFDAQPHWSLVTCFQIFCHKKQEDDCERVTSLIWNNGSME